MRNSLFFLELQHIIVCLVVALSWPQKAYPCAAPDRTRVDLQGLERIPVEGTLALTVADLSALQLSGIIFEVKDPSGAVVSGTLSKDENRHLLVWQSDNPLSASTTYQATIQVPRLSTPGMPQSFTFTTLGGPLSDLAAPTAAQTLLREQEFDSISACCNTTPWSCPPECQGVEYGYRSVVEVDWNIPTELLFRYYDISWERVDSAGQSQAAHSETSEGSSESIINLQEPVEQQSEQCFRLKLTRWVDGATTSLAPGPLVRDDGLVCLSGSSLQTVEHRSSKRPDLDRCMGPVTYRNESGEEVPYTPIADEGGGCSIADRNSSTHLWICLIFIVSFLIYIDLRNHKRRKNPYTEF